MGLWLENTRIGAPGRPTEDPFGGDRALTMSEHNMYQCKTAYRSGNEQIWCHVCLCMCSGKTSLSHAFGRGMLYRRPGFIYEAVYGWLPQRSHYDTCRYIVDHACNSTMSRPGAWDRRGWGVGSTRSCTSIINFLCRASLDTGFRALAMRMSNRRHQPSGIFHLHSRGIAGSRHE